MSETGRYELHQDGDGNKWEYIVRQIEWTSMSPTAKITLATYITGYAVTSLYYTYNEGKTFLLDYRNGLALYEEHKFNSEWEATRFGCTHKKYSIFWDSLFWPGSLFSAIMPSVIMFFN